MRLFAAVTLPDDVVEHLVTALHPIYDERLRWVDKSSLHITLAFYPQVDERQLADLTERLSRAGQRHRPMRLHLARSGHFDHAVLWVGVHGDTQPLRKLAWSAGAAGRRAGVSRDTTRKFRPHITVARSRNNDLRPYVDSLSSYQGPSWQVEDMTLFRSHPGSGPGERPAYERLSIFPLGAA